MAYTTYYYIWRTVNNSAVSGNSAEVSASSMAIPGIPTTPTITGFAGMIQVTWTAVANATSYNVYRSTASGQEVVFSKNITGLFYNDTSVSGSALTFYYTITALTACGE